MGNIGEARHQKSDHENLQRAWVKQWPYIMLALSVVAAIGTGVPGLKGISGPPLAIAWFHISVFSGAVFAVIGAAQYIHDGLTDLKTHLSAVDNKEKPLRDAIAVVEQVANNLRSDVRCEYVGDDEGAFQYLRAKCRSADLLAIRGTLVRSDDNHGQYSTDTYRDIEESLRVFLARPDTYLEEVVGPTADRKLIEAYIAGAAPTEKEEANRVGWFKLQDNTAILSFHILTFRESGGTEKYDEVLFGGSRYAIESNEAVFRSRDSRVVEEFKSLYEALRKSSDRVSASGVRERPNRGLTIQDKWDMPTLYKLMKRIESFGAERGPGNVELRISTSFFIDYFGLREEVLLPLNSKGVRIQILFMNPDNHSLLDARFGLRQDDLITDRARHDLLSDLRALSKFPNVEVRVSDSMPCGFVAQCAEWAVLGLMPSQASYVTGPMIQAPAGSHLWETLHQDWNLRWNAARHYDLSSPLAEELSFRA